MPLHIIFDINNIEGNRDCVKSQNIRTYTEILWTLILSYKNVRLDFLLTFQAKSILLVIDLKANMKNNLFFGKKLRPLQFSLTRGRNIYEVSGRPYVARVRHSVLWPRAITFQNSQKLEILVTLNIVRHLYFPVIIRV